jgi:hypothetical protein
MRSVDRDRLSGVVEELLSFVLLRLEVLVSARCEGFSPAVRIEKVDARSCVFTTAEAFGAPPLVNP